MLFTGIRAKSLGVVALVLLVPAAGPASAGEAASPASVSRYLPDDCHFLISVRVDQFLRSGVWKGVRDDAPNLRSLVEQVSKETPLTPEQVEYVVMADSGREKEASFWIVRLNKPVKGSELAAAQKDAKFSEREVAGQTVYENRKKADDSFAVVDGRTILGGRAEKIRAVLERGGAPKLGAGLEATLREADFARTFVVVADSTFFKSDKSKKQTGGKVDEKFFKPLKGVVTSAQAGDDLAVELTVLCKDPEVAEDARKLADGGLVVLKYALKDDKDVPKEVYDLIRQVKTSSEGRSARASVTVPMPALAKLARSINQDKDKKPKKNH